MYVCYVMSGWFKKKIIKYSLKLIMFRVRHLEMVMLAWGVSGT